MAKAIIHQELLQCFSQQNKEEQQSLLGLIQTFVGSRKPYDRQTSEE
jgi:hypothetical protein